MDLLFYAGRVSVKVGGTSNLSSNLVVLFSRREMMRDGLSRESAGGTYKFVLKNSTYTP